jgi:alpha-glucosidase
MWLTFLSLISCTRDQKPLSINSPNQEISVNLFTTELSEPAYSVHFKDKLIIDTSRLGFTFKEMQPLEKDISIVGSEKRSFEESWQPVWGTKKEISNHFNELTVLFRENFTPSRLFKVIVRVYNDGLGLRYDFPAQEEEELPLEVTIMAENTQFIFTGDHDCWWIPADYDSYEYTYDHTKISGIDASRYSEENRRPDRRIANFRAVNTPVTLKTAEGNYISMHEANLTDYAGMTLAVTSEKPGFRSELVPWVDGSRVKTRFPFVTPWRTIQITDKATDLIDSDLILNLNEPSSFENTDWIEPMKYTGIWWELHVRKSSWAVEASKGFFPSEVQGYHGANTGNAIRYIDFNAKNGIKGLLIEGWNTGWEYWGADTTEFFDFVTPYPDFNIEEVVRYGKENDVEIIGHHETSGDAQNYDKRLDQAFKFYRDLGIKAVKTGYAGGITPKGERHHGQWMVRHYRKVVETAAKYQISINAHEPIKDTGIRRTWPNMMTREGVRGMEYNAWSQGNPPDHTTILPFTRMLSGPLDYTPGIFDIKFDQYRTEEHVKTTLAKQLALMVVLYSPLQMAADMVENYVDHPAFQFIRDVGVDWEESLSLDGEIGEYLSIARKEKNTGKWFLGAISNKEARTLDVSLDFLEPEASYKAVIYADAPDAHWYDNPLAMDITEQRVDQNASLTLKIAPGGGAAVTMEMISN